MTTRMTTSQPLQDPPVARKNDKSDKDLPLIQDIRLLGRILGDVIREQDGDRTNIQPTERAGNE